LPTSFKRRGEFRPIHVWAPLNAGKPERRKREQLRLPATRIRTRNEQTFEAVAFQVCDRGRSEGHRIDPELRPMLPLALPEDALPRSI
jgi:hypothetical protein